MKNKILKIFFILVVFMFAINLKVFAANIVSTDKEVNSGEGNVTISVTSKQPLGAYKLYLTDTAGLTLVGADGGQISADNKTITSSSAEGTTALGSYTFKVPTVTEDTTYRIKFFVSGMETTDLETVASEDNTAVLKVKAPANTTPEPTPTPTPEPTPEPDPAPAEKSTEARLRKFGCTPNDFSGFSKNTNKEEWSTEVPNSVTQVEIYAEPKDSKASVKYDKKVTLKEGNNVVKVVVTAEAGNTKTYTLTIKRKTAEEEQSSTEARLSNLGIKPEEYDFSGFKRDTMEYSVEVPNAIEEVEVYAKAVSSKAKIEGAGTIKLNEGDNKVEVTVTAEDGETTKTYILNVKREVAEVTPEPETPPEETTKPLALTTLTIKNLNLSPKFSSNTYEYTIGLTEDISKLEIETKANNEKATVEVFGNEDLKQGENIITIIVKNAETEESVTYQIVVNKNVQQEQATASVDWLKPSTWGFKQYLIISVLVVLIIIVIVAIILKIKLLKDDDDEDIEFPGADELDRAIAEHQELFEDDSYTNDEENSEATYEDNSESTDDYEYSYDKSNFNENNSTEYSRKQELDEFFRAQEDEPRKRRGRHF